MTNTSREATASSSGKTCRRRILQNSHGPISVNSQHAIEMFIVWSCSVTDTAFCLSPPYGGLLVSGLPHGFKLQILSADVFPQVKAAPKPIKTGQEWPSFKSRHFSISLLYGCVAYLLSVVAWPSPRSKGGRHQLNVPVGWLAWVADQCPGWAWNFESTDLRIISDMKPSVGRTHRIWLNLLITFHIW